MKDVPPTDRPSEEAPHVPAFRSWTAIYLTVLAFFALNIVLLVVWSRWLE